MTAPTVVNMWCGPRTVSTALMYSWRQRADTRVFDEPFYGIYLRHTDPGHPGRDEILAAMPDDVDGGPGPDPGRRPTSPSASSRTSATTSTPSRRRSSTSSPTPSSSATPPGWSPRSTPPSTPTSRSRSPACPSRSGSSTTSWPPAAGPIVVDAHRLLADPAGVLRALCAAVGVPYDEAMLTLAGGPEARGRGLGGALVPLGPPVHGVRAASDRRTAARRATNSAWSTSAARCTSGSWPTTWSSRSSDLESQDLRCRVSLRRCGLPCRRGCSRPR